jgi:hypothetical protein
MGTPLEAARTRLVLAEALRTRSTQVAAAGEAAALLAPARAQFTASGAALDLAEAEQVAANWAAVSAS